MLGRYITGQMYPNSASKFSVDDNTVDAAMIIHHIKQVDSQLLCHKFVIQQERNIEGIFTNASC